METTSKKHLASCHCGSVEFEVQLTDEFNTIRRCSCSYCRMRGAVAASAQLDGIRFIQGADMLTLYQFNTKTAKHYFCSICGIYTHHQRRSNPKRSIRCSNRSIINYTRRFYSFTKRICSCC